MKRTTIPEGSISRTDTRASSTRFNVLGMVFTHNRLAFSTTVATTKPSAAHQQQVRKTRLSLLAAEKLEVQQLVEQHQASIQEWRNSLPLVQTTQGPSKLPQTVLEQEDSDEEHPLYIEYLPISEEKPLYGLLTPRTTSTQSASNSMLPRRLKSGSRSPS